MTTIVLIRTLERTTPTTTVPWNLSHTRMVLRLHARWARCDTWSAASTTCPASMLLSTRLSVLSDKHAAQLDVLCSDVVSLLVWFSILTTHASVFPMDKKPQERLSLCCSLRDNYADRQMPGRWRQERPKDRILLDVHDWSPSKVCFCSFFQTTSPQPPFSSLCSVHATEDTSQQSLTLTMRMLWLMVSPSILASGILPVRKTTHVCAPFRTHRQTSSFFVSRLHSPPLVCSHVQMHTLTLFIHLLAAHSGQYHQNVVSRGETPLPWCSEHSCGHCQQH